MISKKFKEELFKKIEEQENKLIEAQMSYVIADRTFRTLNTLVGSRLDSKEQQLWSGTQRDLVKSQENLKQLRILKSELEQGQFNP